MQNTKLIPPAATVLLYNPDGPERLKRIRSYLERNHIRLILVRPEDYGKPIGALLGLIETDPKQDLHLGSAFPEEMLVMFAFQGTMMRDFLQFFREAEMPSISRKAVVTPTNVFWNSVQLYEELSREAEWFANNGKR